MSDLKLGLIGLDTSHVEAFAEVFNNPQCPHYIKGFRITHAFAGGSPDFPLSINRVGGFTRLLSENYGVSIVESPESVARSVDAILLTTADGRLHPEQFRVIAPQRKPTFINKPLAVSAVAAAEIARTASQFGVRVFSSSNLRFSDVLIDAISKRDLGEIIGADVAGPLPLEDTQPGFFWYGIHLVEMLFCALGPRCSSLQVSTREGHELVVAEWECGRFGTIRGNRVGCSHFTVVLRRERGDQWVDLSRGAQPCVGLANVMAEFFRGGVAPVPLDETEAVVRFIEIANESRRTGNRMAVPAARSAGSVGPIGSDAMTGKCNES